MTRSRRSRRLEKKTKRNIILTLVGIIFVLFIIAKFGIPAIANFAIFVSGFKTSNESAEKKDSFIQPPIFNPVPSATNSAQFEISGTAVKNSTIQLYINDQLVDSELVDKNEVFNFSQTLSLGDNQIKARVDVNGKKSEFSDTITVTYIGSAPSLTIDTPADGENFSKDKKSVDVTGKVDAETTVTVNGFWAIVDENNNYSYNLPLKSGDNEIKVVVTDLAGNKTEKVIRVKYSE